MRLQILGKQRTGTNYLAELVSRNLEAEVRQDGKHGPITAGIERYDPEGYLVLAKHPWSWLVSFRDWHSHPDWDKPERLWRQLKGLLVETPRFDPFKARDWLQDYALAYDYWARVLPQDATVRIRYEDLLADLAGELARVAEAFALDPPERYEDVGERVEPGGEVSESPFDPTYYVEERWREAFTERDVRRILKLVERAGIVETLEGLGYDLRGGWSFEV